MSERNNSEEKASPGEGARSALTFEERVAHLAAGYSNSQSVVHFLDTKAVAVIGVVPVVLGILAAVFNWLQESWQWEKVIDLTGLFVPIVFGALMVGLAIALLVLACLAVAAAFNAIAPQDTGDARPRACCGLFSRLALNLGHGKEAVPERRDRRGVGVRRPVPDADERERAAA